MSLLFIHLFILNLAIEIKNFLHLPVLCFQKKLMQESLFVF